MRKKPTAITVQMCIRDSTYIVSLSSNKGTDEKEEKYGSMVKNLQKEMISS